MLHAPNRIASQLSTFANFRPINSRVFGSRQHVERLFRLAAVLWPYGSGLGAHHGLQALSSRIILSLRDGLADAVNEDDCS